MAVVSTPEARCYACGKPIGDKAHEAVLIDDDGAVVHVGPDCFREIRRGWLLGLVPPRGGPRLFANRACRAAYLITNPKEQHNGKSS